MATSAMVFMVEEQDDNTFKATGIYVHGDGYLDGVGKTLTRSWTDPVKLRNLYRSNFPYLSSLGDVLESCSCINSHEPIQRKCYTGITKATLLKRLESERDMHDFVYLFDELHETWRWYSREDDAWLEVSTTP